jgi:hypothetical protein
MRNTETNSVEIMQNFSMLMQVVHIVTTWILKINGFLVTVT